MMWKLPKWFNIAEISLGRFFGIPVSLHFSCWIFLLFQATISSYLFLVYALVYGIILLHEFGHSFAAYKLGVNTNNIKLYLCGGVASLETVPKQPWKELLITIAGPCVNLLLIPILFGASYFSVLAKELLILDIILLVFNLLPVFPMDGGRVLRSMIAAYTNNHYLSTLFAVRIGQVLVCLAFPFCLYFGEINLILICVFLFIAAEMELKSVVNMTHPSPAESMRLMLEAHAALMEVAKKHKSEK